MIGFEPSFAEDPHEHDVETVSFIVDLASYEVDEFWSQSISENKQEPQYKNVPSRFKKWGFEIVLEELCPHILRGDWKGLILFRLWFLLSVNIFLSNLLVILLLSLRNI
jgi:hypothetical protein